MNKATELLQQAKTFYIATMDGDQPRVRPFGATAKIEGKTYICMNNTKKSLDRFSKTQRWKFAVWLVINKPDDGIYEVFYFSKLSGTIESFNEPKETFEL